MKAPLPANERQRLAALAEYRLFGTPPESAFDDLARLAAQVCQTPIALVTLIGENQQWLKAHLGVDTCQTSRDEAFCAHAILHPETLVVPDATQDPRFADNPLVTGPPHLRFYAGAPLITAEGHGLGTLCVADVVPRTLSAEQVASLERLARQAMAQLELRRRVLSLGQTIAQRDEARRSIGAQVAARSTTLGRHIGIGFALALALLLGLSLLSYQATRDLVTAMGRVAHTHAVEAELNRLMLSITQAESARRGVALQGPTVHLAMYDDAKRKAKASLAQLRDLLADSPHQGQRVADLQAALRDRVAHLDRMVAASVGPSASAPGEQDQVTTGVDLQRRVLAIGAELSAAEARQLADHKVQASRTVAVTHVALGVGSVAALGVVVVSGLLVRRDLRRRQQAEERLESVNAELQTILEASTQVSIITTDTSGVITLFNAGAERLLGYRSEEVVGRQTPVIIHDGQEVARRGAELTAQLGRPVAGFEVFVALAGAVGIEEREWTYIRKDGSRFPVSLLITAVHDPVGNRIGYLGIAVDITERKKAEEGLREARAAAEAANRAKSAFLANMSHEIRTPMNGIVGMSELLLDTALGAEQREFAETIARSADALLTILNDILDFSKIEAGKLELEPLPFDLEATIQDLAQLLAIRAEARGVELLVRYAPGAPRQVVADQTRIRQILLNLASNAVKFTEHGYVLINVECPQRTGDRAVLGISVEDTGIGIAPDKLSGIFEEFTQADASTTRKYGGTGLGLAICKRLVAMHGGTIDVVSQPGRGTTFRCTLSLTLDDTPPAPAAAAADLAGLRFLIVDDNPVHRRILSEQLASQGLRHDHADGAVQALDLLRRAAADGDPYQLAIVDHQLPDLDGEALGRAIRADAQLLDTGLILLSAFGTRRTTAELAEAGVLACLAKPVPLAQLLRALAVAREAQLQARAGDRGAVVQALQALQPPAPPAQALQFPGLRVLLVEDNPTNQLLTIRVLRKLGCVVQVANDGADALRKLRAERFDAVLMDCQMPVMDGYEAARRIREWEGGRIRIPVIAMTAHAVSGDRDRCLQAGMDDYLAKPVKIQDLVGALARQCPGAARVAPPASPSAAAAAPPPDDALDLAQGLRATDGDRAFLHEVLAVFRGDLPGQLDRILAASQAGDAGALELAAHSLAGAAANVGARQLSEAARQVETAAREGRLPAAQAIVAQLHATAEAFGSAADAFDRADQMSPATP